MHYQKKKASFCILLWSITERVMWYFSTILYSFLLCGTVGVGLLYKTFSDIFRLMFLVKALQMDTVQQIHF